VVEEVMAKADMVREERVREGACEGACEREVRVHVRSVVKASARRIF
jgi:hypothetical protein